MLPANFYKNRRVSLETLWYDESLLASIEREIEAFSTSSGPELKW